MTDTTAPAPGYIEKAAKSVADNVLAYWDKLVAGILGVAVSVATVWFAGYLNAKAAPPAPVVKTVEVIRTVPSNLEAKIDSLAKDISDLKAALPSRKKK